MFRGFKTVKEREIKYILKEEGIGKIYFNGGGVSAELLDQTGRFSSQKEKA